MVKGEPVPIEVPPEAAEYHVIVPDEAVAAKETVPVPDLLPEVVAVMLLVKVTAAVVEFADGHPPLVKTAI